MVFFLKINPKIISVTHRVCQIVADLLGGTPSIVSKI
ncbi:hypothetical protein PEDI_38600 [Persicobacter diffluens]|uniref:Uncharacterized protein n=1 Tax=Persicobacter diffluens TaxID=981 RepID=A0AAN4W0V9_9BACT|nr:hypothetical protein PEDI_38600 [Persicobacter diffluens]